MKYRIYKDKPLQMEQNTERFVKVYRVFFNQFNIIPTGNLDRLPLSYVSDWLNGGMNEEVNAWIDGDLNWQLNRRIVKLLHDARNR